MNSSSGALSFEAVIKDINFKAQLDIMERRILGLSNTAVRETNKIDDSFRRLGQLAIGGFGFRGLTELPQQLLRVRGEFEQLEVSFTTMLRSKTQADALLASVTQYAANSSFSLKDTATGAKQLLAYGFAAEQIVPTLRKLGDISAGLGLPLERLTYLFGTAKTQGRLFANDLNQFVGSGIPLIKTLADQFGVAEDKVKDLVEQGKVGFPQVEKAINSLTSGSGIFAGLTEAQSKTLLGLKDKLGDAYDKMLNEIGKKNQGLAIDLINTASDVVENYQTVVNILGLVVTTVGAYKAATMLASFALKEKAALNLIVANSVDKVRVAEIAQAAASVPALRAELSALAAKKAETIALATAQAAALKVAQQQLATAQAAAAAGATLLDPTKREALNKAAVIAQNNVIAAQESASIARKEAIAAASTFYSAKAAIGATVATAQATAETRLTAAQALRASVTQRLTALQTALNGSMLANPYVLVGTAVVALAAAYFTFDVEVQKVKTAQEVMADSGKEVTAQFRQQSGEVRTLIGVIKNQNVAESERLKAYDKLKSIAPDIIQGLDFQRAKTADLTKATNDYIASLRQRIQLEVGQGKLKDLYDQDAEAAKKLKEAEDKLLANKNNTERTHLGMGQYGQSRAQMAQQEYDNAVAFKKKTEAELKKAEENIGRIYEGTASKEELQANIAKQERIMAAATDKLSPSYKYAEDALKKYREELARVIAAEKANQKAQADSIDEIDAKIKAQQEKLGQQRSTADAAVVQAEIKRLQEQRRRLLGEQSDEEKRQAAKAKKEAEKSGPYGSIDYWEQISKKASEILEKLPASDTNGIAKQAAIKFNADKQVEDLRKQYAIKSFEEEIEDKKNKFILYQKWVETYGKEAADAQFGELLKSGNSYLEYLNKQIAALEAKKKSGSLNQADSTNLGNLIGQRDEIKGEKSALDLFNDKLERAQREATTLTELLDRLSKMQAELDTKAPVLQEDFAIKERLAKLTADTKQQLKENLGQYLQEVDGSEAQRLAITKKYADLRLGLELQYANKFKDQAYDTAAKNLTKNEEQELKQLKNRVVQTSDSFKKLDEVIVESGRAAMIKRLAALNKALKDEANAADTQDYKNKQKERNSILTSLKNEDLERINEFGALVGQLGDAFIELGGDAANAGQFMAGFASQINNLTKAFEDDLSSAQKAQIAIQGAVTLINIITSAAAQRKKAETEYYAAIIAQQQQYNLLLNEEIGLRAQSKENIFVKNYIGELKDGFEQYDDAQAKYQDALNKLAQGQAKVGQGNAVDWNAVGKGAVTGATIGAALGGPLAPVTAAIGAGIGAIVGLFGGKKKEDEFAGLLQLYPQLIKKTKDGVDQLNISLAQSLIDTNQVDDATKALLQSTIDWQKQVEAAQAAIKSIVKDLVGDLGSKLGDSLIQAFKDGTDAAMAFKGTLEDVLEGFVTKLIYTKVFSPYFDALQADILKSLDTEHGGDGSIIDDLQKFYKNAGPGIDLLNKALEDIQDQAKSAGFDILKNKVAATSAQSNSLSNAIKGVSEETAGLVAGQMNAMRIQQANTHQLINQQLLVLNNIDRSSAIVAQNSRYLESIDKQLGDIKSSLKDGTRAMGIVQ